MKTFVIGHRETCKKHGSFIATMQNHGYCEKCYPHPRVYCMICGQPLTCRLHRARGYGARCKREAETLLQQSIKDEVKYVEIGTKEYRQREYKDMGDLF